MTERALEVMKLFGMDAAHVRERAAAFAAAAVDPPTPGEVVLISGPSGGGKSGVLARVKAAWAGSILEPETLELPAGRAVIDAMDPCDVMKALEFLGLAGLAEAHLFVGDTRRLSGGQRFRLKLALAMAAIDGSRGESALVVWDEFCAVLDVVAAKAVARGLRRVVDRWKCAAVVATARDDLERALDPDVVVFCDFGRMTVRRRSRYGIEPEPN